VDTSTQNDEAVRAAYLDLLKRSLVNWLYRDIERRELLRLGDYALVASTPFDPQRRRIGRDYSVQAHTLVGLERLDNIQYCAETVLADGIPGDFIETGVWRGGCCVFMRGILKAWGIGDRAVWLADSFRGLPEPDAQQYPDDKGARFHEMDELAVPVDSVKDIFDRYGLLDDQVRFLEGWFRDTLPEAPIDKLAVLRLDGDMYESTMDVLRSLYHRLSPGGFVIVDDYGAYAACRNAVHDFRDANGMTEPIREVDWTGVYWRKE